MFNSLYMGWFKNAIFVIFPITLERIAGREWTKCRAALTVPIFGVIVLISKMLLYVTVSRVFFQK